MGQLTPQLTGLGAQPVAVAVTATYSQMAFARSLAAPFPMLSDWSRQVCAAYGARYDLWKGHDGLAKRSVFVVDGSGSIRYRWVSDDAAVQPDFDAVLAAVAELTPAAPAGRPEADPTHG